MKYIITIITMLIISTSSAMSQTQADIDRLFASHADKDGNAKEIIISGDALKGTDLKTYHSLGITDSPN